MLRRTLVTVGLAIAALAVVDATAPVARRSTAAGRLRHSPHSARAPQPSQTPQASLPIDSGTRLLVVAPHPDDEMLGAAGLMQRVSAAHGSVHVVYLTDGDGYSEGVAIEEHVSKPRPKDYRGYGRERRKEASEALAALRLGTYSFTFLSFPDGGLCNLLTKYWSENRKPFKSPYTRLDRPPKSNVVVPDSEYTGEDLTQELAKVIGDFRPTLIAVPRPEDQHGDHCAASYFVHDAIGDVVRVDPQFSVDVINYIIHYNAWPFDDEDQKHLPRPHGLRSGVSGWITVPLGRREMAAKRAALGRYRSQMKTMGWFLKGFVRSNELFSRPAPGQIALPLKRNPCCDK